MTAANPTAAMVARAPRWSKCEDCGEIFSRFALSACSANAITSPQHRAAALMACSGCLGGPAHAAWCPTGDVLALAAVVEQATPRCHCGAYATHQYEDRTYGSPTRFYCVGRRDPRPGWCDPVPWAGALRALAATTVHEPAKGGRGGR